MTAPDVTPSALNPIPAELWSPATAIPATLPVVTRVQELPFGSLAWENFEKLCLRMVSQDGEVEYCQRYGTKGQYQAGIDFYVRRKSSGKYSVSQCKRYEEFSPADLVAAVDEFLKGTWVDRSDTLQVMVAAACEPRLLAEEIETQAARLKVKGIALVVSGESQLSLQLKPRREMVEDFFGEPWADAFCGGKGREVSARTLSPGEIAPLRRELRNFYQRHFESVDSGLPLVAAVFAQGIPEMPLEKRYVIPDIQDQQLVTTFIPRSNPPATSAGQGQPAAAPPMPARMQTESLLVRRNLPAWLTEADQTVVIGEPGSGKSTLLRYLMLELLHETPSQVALVKKWGNRIPLWVPFALWSRLVAEQPAAAGLDDCLKYWLQQMTAPQALVDLVLRALKDERLLLLVDGLDEWSNETAARTAMTALCTFVMARNVPAVVTSRPLGYARLGGLGPGWRTGELAGLTSMQQTDLAERWFTFQNLVSSTLSPGSGAIDARPKARRLVEDIQKVPGLARLASTALLMCGLIALRWRNLRLPSNRFLAYWELTQLLLELHPQQRLRSALAVRNSLPLSEQNRARVLAALAFAIHQAPGSVSISKQAATDVVADFLIRHLRMASGEAFQQAEMLLDIGADSLGLLVEKARDEIGFVHRVFQEHLAARHLARLPFKEQQTFVATCAIEAPWQDVILNLCHLNERENEIDELLGTIEGLAYPVHLVHEREQLLAEVAFNDLHCSPTRAHKIAGEVFEAIEFGSWMHHREKLLACALDGLASDVLGSAVRARVKTWFPKRSGVANCAAAMERWPRDEVTSKALLLLLNSEDAGASRAAADTLARIYTGDPGIMARLLREVRQPADAAATAARVRALWQGWPSNPAIEPLLAEAAESESELVRLAGLCGQVGTGLHTEQMRDLLLEYCWDRSMVAWEWRDDVVTALVAGWPGDPVIKRHALQSFRHQWRDPRFIDTSFAAPILLQGFAKDTDVEDAFIELFTREKYPDNRFDSNWILFAKAFAGRSRLGPAIETWLSQREYMDAYEVHFCAKVHRSDNIKKILIDLLPKTGIETYWTVISLIEHWGKSDPAVAAAFSAKLKDPKRPRSISRCLPLLTDDLSACRNELLEDMRGADEAERCLAVMAFSDLPAELRDEEVATTALAAIGESKDGVFHDGARSVLIEYFGHHAPVREFARREARRRSGYLALIAKKYADDPEIRGEVLAVAFPLAAKLRRQIVDRLSAAAGEDDFAFAQLGDYDCESDDELKTLAAIGYYEAAATRSTGIDRQVERLTKDLKVVGPDYDLRRRAALAGLLALDRMDIAAAAKDHDGKPTVFAGGDPMDRNRALCSYACRHWNRMRRAFGDGIWERFRDSKSSMFRVFVEEARDPQLVEALVDMAQNPGEGETLQASGLHFLARQRPRAEFLRTLCLKGAGSGISDWYSASAVVACAEILAEQFADDSTVQRDLEAMLGRPYDRSGAIIALSLGWPASPALQDRSLFLSDSRRKYLVPAEVHLHCRMTPASDFLPTTGKLIAQLNGSIWDFLPATMTALRNRFRDDEELCHLGLQRLQKRESSVMGKMALSRLISSRPKFAPDVRQWARGEVVRQTSGEKLPEIALDVYSGVERPVAHVLLELLK